MPRAALSLGDSLHNRGQRSLAASSPRSRVGDRGKSVAGAHNLPNVVDAGGAALLVARQGAQVDDAAAGPLGGVVDATNDASANHLPSVVNAGGFATRGTWQAFQTMTLPSLHSVVTWTPPTVLTPTTCPALLIATATLPVDPGKLPSLTMLPPLHSVACGAPPITLSLSPTTCPASLTSSAKPVGEPGGSPKSMMLPPLH